MRTGRNCRHVLIQPERIARSHLVRRVIHRPNPYPGNPLILGSDFCDREKLSRDASVESGEVDQHAYVANLQIREGLHPWFNPSTYGRLGWVRSVVRSPLTGRLQMYYCINGNLNLVDIGTTGGAFATCYAESDDGVHWHMPILGRFRAFGTNENNIMFPPPSEGFVRVDYHQPDPSKRYVAFVHHGPRIYTSPDGIHWSEPIRAVLETKIGRSDGDSFFGWDDRIGKYVAYFRPWKESPEVPADKPLRRRVGRAVSDDLARWYDHRTILSADELDGPVAQIEKMAAWPYQDFYLGLAQMMLNFSEERRTYSFMMGSLYEELVFSRDNLKWERFPERDPFISAVPGVKNRGMILTGDAPVEVGDELYFYYSQTPHHHGELPNCEGICLAKIVKDRFVGWRADNEIGFVETTPVVCPGGRLHINADLRHGDMRVALILRDGMHSLEHAAYRCGYMHGELPFHIARWQRTDNLEALKGQEISLKFYLRNAEVFSFWFE